MTNPPQPPRTEHSLEIKPSGLSIAACAPVEFDKASVAFSARNPATGTLLPFQYRAATRGQINDAANAAWKAFHTGRGIDQSQRASMLRLIADRLGEAKGDLTTCANQETGLPVDRLENELGRTISTLRLFAEVVEEGTWQRIAIDPPQPGRRPNPRPGLRSMFFPLGPVAVFGASNFPLAYSTMGTDAASALAAGCPVIVKGHALHPGTGEIAAQVTAGAIRDAGFPHGWFSFLHAGGDREQEIGIELLEHPCVRAAGFTGSVGGGAALSKVAAERPDPIPFYAEMGSTNPTFLLPGSLSTEPVGIAQHLARAIGQYAGQQCTCPGLIFLSKSASSASFIDRLTMELDAFPPTPMLAARIRKNYLDRLQSILALPGVRMVLGDAGAIRTAGTKTGPDRPTHEKPVLIRTNADTFISQQTLQEEIFGPAALLVECESASQIVDCAGVIQGTLASSIFLSGSDLQAAEELIEILSVRAGRIVFNGVTTGVEVGHATVHGGPFPASNRAETTAVGPFAMHRWCRPVSFQNAPANLLPPDLTDENPRDCMRLIDGNPTRGPIKTAAAKSKAPE